jgi:carbonic anhydrase
MKNILTIGLIGLLLTGPVLASETESAKAASTPAKEVKKVVPGKVEAPADAVAAKKPAANVDEDLRKALTARLSGGSGEVFLSGNDLEPKAATVTAGATTAPKRRTAQQIAASEAAKAAAHAHMVHWSYEGDGAPANWGKLNNDYTMCESGKRQSPIDIRGGINVDLPTLKFSYVPSLFRVIDNGHTVQVNYGEGSMLTVQGRQYQLVQFHFHKPSEERVNGRVYDMVVHLVHKDEQGRLAVVAVLLDKGAEHPLIQTVWNNLPLERNEEVSPPEAAIDLNQLLPENLSYFTYMGSLTTPPCTEGVMWIVLKQPAKISVEQIAVFNRLYKNNARPLQRVDGRLIKESR